MSFEKEARRLRPLIEKAAAGLADEDALGGVELFPKWATGIFYEVSARIRHGGRLYRCVQAHMSQTDWTPDRTPALWTVVSAPGTIPVWRQPSGTQDAYMTGDRVRYPDENGPVYESLIDGNTWSPEAYPAGWKLI